MFRRLAFAACAFTAVCAAPTHAATLALDADGLWHEFTVDAAIARSGGLEWVQSDTLAAGYGEALSFTFTIGAGSTGMLTVVDNAFAGDRFAVTNGGVLLAYTSAVGAQTIDSAPLEFDNDAALANPSFSSRVLSLGAGSYTIGGSLVQSLLLSDLTPLNATTGALRLQVSAVPEPASVLTMFGGLALLGLRRHARRPH